MGQTGVKYNGLILLFFFVTHSVCIALREDVELLCETDEHGTEDDAQHVPQQIGDQETSSVSEENNAAALQRAIGLRTDNR